ncbi:MAG: GNAT family N-acetyltransferase [Actinomycetota bacterium]|nr:GNAT family N-acetyltransferase [Actinomycetota bacterium]
MDLAPLFALRLRTPRLELRLPTRDELVELFRVAERGIHPADEMPFGVAWTDDLRLEPFLEFHERALADWTPERWDCNFVTFLAGRPIGTQSLHGREFAATHDVGSGSWLGAPYQGHGYGTEQRAAVLELAFRGLAANAATSGALIHNRASQRVSEKLGYREIGRSTLAPRGEPVPHIDYRLERQHWRRPFRTDIEGLEPCLRLFGADD